MKTSLKKNSLAVSATDSPMTNMASAIPPVVPAKVFSSVVGKKREYQSNSAIETYIDCGGRYYFRYIMGYKIRPSYPAMQGTAQAKALEINFKKKIKTGNDMRFSSLEDALMEELDAQIIERQRPLKPGEMINKNDDEGVSLNKIRKQSRQALRVFHTLISPNIQPVEAEYELEIPTNSFGVDGKEYKNIVLRMDLIAKAIDPQTGKWLTRERKALIILDHKLTGKKPQKDSAKRSMQLTLYAQAFEKKFGCMPETTGLIHVVKNVKPRVYVNLAKKTKADFRCYNARMKEVLLAVQNRIWIPANPSWWGCSKKFCGFWGMCPWRPR